jgi:hypothetical protein
VASVWFGMTVQAALQSGAGNNGVDKVPAIVTHVHDSQPGPNGGVMVSIQTQPNRTLSVLGLGEWVASCEVMDYDHEARAIVDTANVNAVGAWPLDVS